MVKRETPVIELPQGRTIKVTVEVTGPSAEGFADLAVMVYEIDLRNRRSKETQPCSR